jgi:hypothetical protein
MFLPSENAVKHLCNALVALPEWYKLFESYGLIAPNKYPAYDYDEDEQPWPVKPSWEELKNELDAAKSKHPEQLRALCGEILRRKDEENWPAFQGADRTKFRDSVAQFLAAIASEGYTFNEFEILGSKPEPSVAQLADEALSKALKSGAVPLTQRVQEHLSKAVAYLSGENYVDCVTNLRLVLKFTLEDIGTDLARRRNDPLPTKEKEVRDYLEKIEFITHEEKNGLSGIYGLLSAGPHGKSDKMLALLGYAACLMACQYAMEKFRSFRANAP